MKAVDQALVSVLLPVRNGGDFLLKAVQSIIEQTYSQWELLVLDDGSDDGALEAVKKIQDTRIRIIQDGEKKGLATRLNEGISLAKGKFIARMDADDRSFPNRFEKQISFLCKNPDVDLVSSKVVTYRADKTMGTLPYCEQHSDIARYPWRGMYMPHPTWMGRAEWFKKFRYLLPEVVLAEDQELLLRALPASKYYSLPEVLLAYHQGEISFKKRVRARFTLLKAQLKIFSCRGEWLNCVLAAGAGLAKIIKDLSQLISSQVRKSCA